MNIFSLIKLIRNVYKFKLVSPNKASMNSDVVCTRRLLCFNSRLWSQGQRYLIFCTFAKCEEYLEFLEFESFLARWHIWAEPLAKAETSVDILTRSAPTATDFTRSEPFTAYVI